MEYGDVMHQIIPSLLFPLVHFTIARFLGRNRSIGLEMAHATRTEPYNCFLNILVACDYLFVEGTIFRE